MTVRSLRRPGRRPAPCSRPTTRLWTAALAATTMPPSDAVKLSAESVAVIDWVPAVSRTAPLKVCDALVGAA